MNIKLKKFSIMLTLLLITVATLSVMAISIKKTSVILFTTSWNAQSREARVSLQQVVNTYSGRVDYIEMDLDSPTTSDNIRSIGISAPRAVPYIVIVDKNSNVRFQRKYNGENALTLKRMLDPIIIPTLE